jgi:Flp pilus assembly protein TadG
MTTSKPVQGQHANQCVAVANKLRNCHARARRGAAAIFGLILTGSLVVLLAITLDFGYITVSQAELRRSVDAAAMAACWELFDQQSNSPAASLSVAPIRSAAEMAASHNTISANSPAIGLTGNDFSLGVYDFSSGSFAAALSGNLNAVRVRLARQTSINGEVPLFFGSLTGRESQALQQHAVAAMINNLKGFYTPGSSSERLDILPIALDLGTWQDVVAGRTSDGFRMVQGQVSSGSDGLHECNLYPQGTGSPGNRGTVDIGGSNNSTADLSRQILHGISRQDFIDLGRPLEFDSKGELMLNGDTGISAGIKDELASIIGKKRIIPIFSRVSGNGNNAMYTIVKFEGVRILEVRLTGSMKSKRLIIQPAKMVARHAVISTDERFASDYLVSPVMIVE